jgi:hypothetical protein
VGPCSKMDDLSGQKGQMFPFLKSAWQLHASGSKHSAAESHGRSDSAGRGWAGQR